MFKNSIDEARFKGVLMAYRAEFGEKDVILYLPTTVAEALDSELLGQSTVRFWKKNRYQIQVKGLSAIFYIQPED